MKWLVLVALLVGCKTNKPIGENDPVDGNTATDDGNGAGSDGSATCSCDINSCNGRVCGRSECGFPCGTCGPGEVCFLGAGCQPVVNSGTPCIDAFGERVGAFDVGFRACPSDSTKQQSCQCSGNGPDAWTACDTTCVEICTKNVDVSTIRCGSSQCSGGAVCCIPFSNQGQETCTTGTCGANQFTRACDGPEDCATGSVCCGGDLVSPFEATCTQGATCDTNPQICHTGADCPSSKPHCCPALLVQGLGSCSETPSADCT
jgi:hypothetical protein